MLSVICFHADNVSDIDFNVIKKFYLIFPTIDFLADRHEFV